jgi:hypothetical protein
MRYSLWSVLCTTPRGVYLLSLTQATTSRSRSSANVPSPVRERCGGVSEAKCGVQRSTKPIGAPRNVATPEGTKGDTPPTKL